jgi:CRP-like cAMP-binding protein/HEAT repeat protein
MAEAVVLGISLVYLTFWLVRDLFEQHWPAYVGRYFDVRSGKRILGLLAGTGRLSIIGAGLLLLVLLQVLAPEAMIGLWALLMGSVAVLVAIMPAIMGDRRAKHDRSQVTDLSLSRQTYGEQLRIAYRQIRDTAYLRGLALMTFLLVFLSMLLAYAALIILAEQYDQIESIVAFTAVTVSVGMLLVLPLRFFVVSRLIRKISPGTVALVFPVLILAAGLMLILLPEALVAAAVAYLVVYVFSPTLRDAVESQLFNAVSLRLKQATQIFNRVVVVPAGIMSAAGVIALAQAVGALLLPVSVVLLSLVYLLATLAVRRLYSNALITMLEQEDLSLVLDYTSDFKADSTTLDYLQALIENSTSDDFTLFIARMMAELGGHDAVEVLEDLADRGNPYVRAGVIDVLAASDMQGQTVGVVYVNGLHDPDARVRKSAIAALQRWVGLDNLYYQDLALELLQDADLDVQSEVLPSLLKSQEFLYLMPAVQSLNFFLNHPNASRRATGIQLLGQTDDARFLRHLGKYLDDEADQVRVATAVAVERLVQSGDTKNNLYPMVQDYVIPLLNDSVERIRVAATRILAHISTAEARWAVIRALADSSLLVRETATEALVQAGQANVLYLEEAMRGDNAQLVKMAAVVLGRIDRRNYGEYLHLHIQRNLKEIYQQQAMIVALHPLNHYRSIRLLEETIREENDNLLDEVFFFLSALHKPDTVMVIQHSLATSDRAVWKNAIQVLDRMVSGQMLRLITTLFNQTYSDAELVQIGVEELGTRRVDTVGTIRDLLTDDMDAWLRSLVTFFLGEIGAELSHAKEAKGKTIFSLDEVLLMLQFIENDRHPEVKMAARAARRLIDEQSIIEVVQKRDKQVLSTIEKIVFLREVPFFAGMKVEQLKTLATVCREHVFAEGETIFSQGEAGGVLYMIVWGKVSAAQMNQASIQLTSLDEYSNNDYFGEDAFFDMTPRRYTATALADTLVLWLHHEPLQKLARQNPDLSLEMINALSQRLRETTDRIVELTRKVSPDVQRIYDVLD